MNELAAIASWTYVKNRHLFLARCDKYTSTPTFGEGVVTRFVAKYPKLTSVPSVMSRMKDLEQSYRCTANKLTEMLALVITSVAEK